MQPKVRDSVELPSVQPNVILDARSPYGNGAFIGKPIIREIAGLALLVELVVGGDHNNLFSDLGQLLGELIDHNPQPADGTPLANLRRDEGYGPQLILDQYLINDIEHDLGDDLAVGVRDLLKVPVQLEDAGVLAPELVGFGDHRVQVEVVWQDGRLKQIQQGVHEIVDLGLAVHQLYQVVCEVASVDPTGRRLRDPLRQALV